MRNLYRTNGRLKSDGSLKIEKEKKNRYLLSPQNLKKDKEKVK